MAGASSSSSSAPAQLGTLNFMQALARMDVNVMRGFLCGQTVAGTGVEDYFKFASWASIAAEDEKINMKSTFQDIFAKGGRGIAWRSLVDPDIGGEDCHFVDDDNGIIAVADGVGDESLQGDSGIYSRYLMYNLRKITSTRGRAGDLFELLFDARDASEVPGLRGKSTACVLRLLPTVDSPPSDDGKERTRIIGANIGDTCALLIRPGEGVIKEAPRQKQRGAPHQLPDYPQGLVSRNRYEFDWEAQEGDVVIAGSDGLFDNMYPKEIADIVHQVLAVAGDASPRELAKRIAEELQRKVRSKVFNDIAPPEDEARAMLKMETPMPTPHHTDKFKEMHQKKKVKKGCSMDEAHMLGVWGGKQDDTVIIVSRITCAPHPPEFSPAGLTNFERGSIVNELQ